MNELDVQKHLILCFSLQENLLHNLIYSYGLLMTPYNPQICLYHIYSSHWAYLFLCFFDLHLSIFQQCVPIYSSAIGQDSHAGIRILPKIMQSLALSSYYHRGECSQSAALLRTTAIGDKRLQCSLDEDRHIVSYCCHNKLPQTWGLQTAHLISYSSKC